MRIMQGLSLPLAARRILVVDDQASVREVLHDALSDAGADVGIAADGPAALASAASQRPDLILLDLAMPGMNGWEVLEALSGAPATAGIPVVLETSSEDFRSFDRARQRGVAAFISKPFRLGEVVETCRRVVEGARPLQGRLEPPPQDVGVLLHALDGALLCVGRLLEHGARGAQVDLERPLRPSQQVSLTVESPDGPRERPAEIRWIALVEGRYHHGLAFL
jgi:CheY-like chemotaxis protein